MGQWILSSTSSPIITRNPSAFQATESLRTQSQRIMQDPGLVRMVLVPAGEFMMGAHQDYEIAGKDEQTTHMVSLNAFYIDQYEVTTARYAKFIQETKRPVSWLTTMPAARGYPSRRTAIRTRSERLAAPVFSITRER